MGAVAKPRTPPNPTEDEVCAMYITYTISEDRTGTADEVMSKRLAALTGSCHQSNRDMKRRPRRKNAWGAEDSASSADDDPSTTKSDIRADQVQISPHQSDICRHKCHVNH
jgi:hypothetical protein